MEIIIAIVGIILIGLLLNYLMGYGKGRIVLELEEWYTDINKHSQAVVTALRDEGRDVQYQGNREFLIDGKTYHLTERAVSTPGPPMQRTILVPDKKA
ncbi:hypothetical protein FLK61_24385 [Paenalkalicoccus suaedae]|uniref:Uncharacterized protein n=1 Tax=Paenalkalicoccus suaedae TaxID=2592382 RepID=A0A859F9Q9_9BACI|nr:hypothetical protein [Paenalkalicoccus suaedae]QKS69923.1 hypothetical protein FLK61_24385 [Paenalkalicoccus suaedae]